MNALILTVIAVVEVFTDDALVPDSDDWCNIAAIALDPFVLYKLLGWVAVVLILLDRHKCRLNNFTED